DYLPFSAGAPQADGSPAPGGNLTAADLSAQARERLADLMHPPGTSGRDSYTRRWQDRPRESTAGTYHRASQDLYPTDMQAVPLPKARPEAADALRPPADIP